MWRKEDVRQNLTEDCSKRPQFEPGDATEIGIGLATCFHIALLFPNHLSIEHFVVNIQVMNTINLDYKYKNFKD